MKRTLLTLLLIASLAVPVFGQGATSWNIYSRPNESWYSGALRGGDLAWEWAKAMDTLMAGLGGAGTGDNFYVDSGLTTAGDGSNWANALATVNEAVALCTANNGDVIHVAQNHTFAVPGADGVDLDVAGIWVKGYGQGTDAPEYTYAATGSEFVIGKANILVSNLRFVAGVSSITMGISIEAAAHHFTMVNCVFPKPTTNSWEFLDAIDVASGATYLSIIGCNYQNDPAGAAPAHFIDLGNAALVGVYIAGNTIYGDFSVSAIWSDDVDTEVYILGNTISQITADEHCIEFSAAATGVCAGNLLYSTAEATTLDPGSLAQYENKTSTATDAEGQPAFRPDDGINQLNATTISAIASGVGGIGFRGTATNNAVTTTVISVDLAGFGNDYFNTGWSILVVLDADGPGTAPEEEVRDITDYVSSTGTFTVDAAFTAALTTSDEIYIRRREELHVDDPAMLNTSGTTWYLDDGGSNGDGRSWQSAKTTLAAVEALVAVGDAIFVGRNHNEALTTGGDLINIAGVSITGMGTGDDRPLFDMDVDADELTLNAAGITLKNLRFRPGATALTSGIIVGAAGIGCVIEDCAFVDGEAAGTDEWTDAIVVNTAASDLTVKNCTFYNTGAPGTFINLDAATIANATIIGNKFFGACTEAPIWGAAAVPTNLLIKDNVVKNTSSGNACIEFQGAATGECIGNSLSGDTYGAILDPGSMRCYGNLQTVGINATAEDVPLVAGRSYARQMLFGDVGAQQDLFSVTGSPIIIEHCWGIASVAIGGAATLNWEVDADSGHDYDLSTAVDIQSVDEGGSIVFTDVVAEGVLTPQALGSSGAGQALSWFSEEGMIETASAGDTGNVEWYIIFKPVFSGGEVIPQTGNDE